MIVIYSSRIAIQHWFKYLYFLVSKLVVISIKVKVIFFNHKANGLAYVHQHRINVDNSMFKTLSNSMFKT